MRPVSALFMGVLALAAMASSALADAPAGYKWNLVWSDDFNSGSTAVAPDATKWGYEIGYKRNNEAQSYTNSLNNVYCQNGLLNIVAIKQDVVSGGKTYHYTSGSINTQNKYSVQYGRIEMSAKLPSQSGDWPAFWTMGVNGTGNNRSWPNTGESDIMEYFPAFNTNSVSSHYLYKDSTGQTNGLQTYIYNIAPYDGFHTYAVEWSPTEMDYYYDNSLIQEITKSQFSFYSGTYPWDNANYILLNLALGGDWGGGIPSDFVTQTYQVDYVHVSQLAAVPEPASLGLLLAALPLLGLRPGRKTIPSR